MIVAWECKLFISNQRHVSLLKLTAGSQKLHVKLLLMMIRSYLPVYLTNSVSYVTDKIKHHQRCYSFWMQIWCDTEMFNDLREDSIACIMHYKTCWLLPLVALGLHDLLRCSVSVSLSTNVETSSRHLMINSCAKLIEQLCQLVVAKRVLYSNFKCAHSCIQHC